MKTVEELNVCFALTDGVKMVNHKSRKLIGQLISRLATMHIICYDDYIIGNTLVVEMEDICYEHVCLYGKRGARGSELVPKEWTTKKWTAKNYQDYGGDKSPFGLCDICVFVVKDKEDINSIEDMLKVAIAKFRKPVHIVIDDDNCKDVIMYPDAFQSPRTIISNGSRKFWYYVNMVYHGNGFPRMKAYTFGAPNFESDIMNVIPIEWERQKGMRKLL